MVARQVVVDGSNIATEGRSLPSLAQLDEAVREFLAENPGDVVTVVVDASFGHRVDPSEVPTFEEAESAGEIVSPPAGAIGRGDAFLLRIAEKIGATVLSNDSFQEFHGEHEWLFEKGRLIGGKPVPGVGWIFMDRTPVRGQKSREVVKEAKRKKKAAVGGDAGEAAKAAAATRLRTRDKKVDRAIARATEEVIKPKDGKRSRRRRGGAPPAEPVNEPLPFITFIAAHPLGSTVSGVVSEFSSHGAFVEASGARCYIPLSAMADPAPRRAREVFAKGEEREFVVQALDPQRRGIELAVPAFAKVAGSPTAETVEAEIHPDTGGRAAGKPSGAKKAAAAKKGAAAKKAAPAKKTAAKKGAPAKKAAPDKKAAAKKKAAAPEQAPPAKKASAKKVTARKAAAGKEAPAKEAPAKKEAAPAKKAAGKAAPAKKKAAAAGTPARKAAAPKKAAGAQKPAQGAQDAAPKKAAPAAKAAPAKKAAAAAKQPAKRAPAKKGTGGAKRPAAASEPPSGGLAPG